MMAKSKEILEAISKLSEGFGRIDERTRNIWRSSEAQEKHLKELNGSTKSLANRVTVIETKVEERTVPKHKMSKKIITGYSGIVLVIITLVYYLGKGRGWW